MKSETIGTRFKKLRERLKLSQQNFARQLNITQQTYSLIEKDKHLPNVKIILILSDNFNVNLNWLISGKGNMFCEPIENIEQYLKASEELKEVSDRLTKIIKGISKPGD